jgi:hypothetical protein
MTTRAGKAVSSRASGQDSDNVGYGRNSVKKLGTQGLQGVDATAPDSLQGDVE